MSNTTTVDGKDEPIPRWRAVLDRVPDRVRRAAPPGSVLIALLVVWEVVAVFDGRSNAYFPTIEFTISQTLEFQDRVITGLQTTFTEAILGFVAALAIGISIGILYAEFAPIRQATLPVVIFSYALPQAVLAPLFLLWFGNDLSAVVLFVAWLAFFTVFVNTMTGFSQIEPEFVQLGEMLGASRWQMVWKVKFWAALPHLSSAAKIAVQQSVVGAIIAEFIATGSGLGYTLNYALNFSETGLLFGSLILLMVFSIVFYKTVEHLIDWLVPAPVDH